MILNRALIWGALALTTMMGPSGSEDIVADHIGAYGINVYHTYGPSGYYTHEFDGDEEFYVDLEKRETVWNLPLFSKFRRFDPQGALRNIATAKHNLEIVIQRSNSTAATNKVPEVTVFSKSPMMLGQPNTLICHVDNIFPPVINITWLKNGHLVIEGISETSFLSKDDHSFSKISYLTFLPSDDDVYDCKVEHWGLDKPLLKHWGMYEFHPFGTFFSLSSPEYPAYYLLNLMAINFTFQGCLMTDFTLLPKPHTPSVWSQPFLAHPIHMHKNILYSEFHNFTFTEPDIPAPMSELTETVVCALGLTVGLVGIVVGTVLIIRGLRSGGPSRHQGPL